MSRLPPRSTQSRSSAASDVYKRQALSAAAASAGGVRILDREARTAHVFDEVHRRAVQLQRALRVDDDLDLAHREDVIGGALLVERETVLETGAAAALD